MSVKLDGLPAELVSADLDQGSVSIMVDATLYPLEALYGAAYIFIDRCYVLLDKADAAHFRIVLAPKKGDADEKAVRSLVGEFSNELLSCAWRSKITDQNRALIEAVTRETFAGAMGPPSLDDLAEFDFTEEPFEDPLGIAQSWEEKYKRKEPEAAAAATPETATGKSA